MPKSAVETLNYFGVDSIVGAKTDPNCAYMTFDGKVFKSNNRGDTWVEASTNLKVRMDANGGSDMAGERLQVDPADKNVVYYGSIMDGLWYTFDGGNSWTQTSESVIPFGDDKKYHKAGILTVHFDEKSGKDAKGRTKTIYVTIAGKGVFQSLDAGTTWNKISGVPGAIEDTGYPGDAAMDKNGNYYVADSKLQSVWRYNTQGKWELILKGRANAIAIDPFDSNRIFVIISAGGWFKRSTDFGKDLGFPRSGNGSGRQRHALPGYHQ